MKFSYETPRLELKVLPASMAENVLEFMERNKDIFDRYEAKRCEDFFTEEFQSKLLTCELQLFLKSQGARFYVFEKNNSDRIIGCVHFYNMRQAPYDSCLVGYKFDKDFQHRGYATEALAAALDIVFRDAKIHRVEATVMPSNTASIKLLEKLGFQCEGLLRKNICIDGRWEDHYLYALLNE